MDEKFPPPLRSHNYAKSPCTPLHTAGSTDFHGCPTKRGGERIGGKIHRPLGEGGRKRNVTKFQPCHVQADIVQAEKLKRRENTAGNTCTVRIKRNV